ncbi:MAG: hydrogenase maturation protease [Bacteroidales bacterium]|nr:hydrogenase maturation protease [Bacteroidales bacterium]
MYKLLLYGYGNPGRQDDGLGIVLAEEMYEWAVDRFPGKVDVDTNYQLNIEDAEKISQYQMVIFADASQENIETFTFTPVSPSKATIEFTMHAMSPAYIVHLCQDLFQLQPECFLLHIKGYEWEMKEGLTENAEKNLHSSLDFLKKKIETVLLNTQNQ